MRSGSKQPPLASILVHRRLDEIRSGSGVYLLGFIERLRMADFDVRIVIAPAAGFGSLPISRPAPLFCEIGCHLIWCSTFRLGPMFVSTSRSVWKRFFKRGLELAHWTLIKRRKTPRPAFRSHLGKMPSARDLDALAAAANAARSDLVIAEYSSLAPALARCRTGVRAVLMHDVFAFRAASFRDLGLSPDHADVPLTTEVDWLNTADICLYASSAEAAQMARHLPDKRHIWLPPRVHPRKISTRKKPHAVFLGVRHGGNEDALDMILSEIWPEVRRALPEAELWVVGEIGESVRNPPEGVRVTGQIEDLGEIGGPDAIGLAPARATSGVSIKIATYLELGMSALTTSMALEGYSGVLDDLVVSADTPAEFSEKLIALLEDSDLREKTARRGNDGISARLDSTGLDSFLSQLKCNRPVWAACRRSR